MILQSQAAKPVQHPLMRTSHTCSCLAFIRSIRQIAACLFGLTITTICAAAPLPGSHYEVAEKGLAELQADMAAGKVDSETLVRSYLARISQLDRAGPQLHAVLSINPDAIREARRLDSERKAGHLRGPLHGIPILIKDNIESDGSMPTTVGSAALSGNVTHRDAEIVRRIKEAGGIILGKNNLAEWGLIRSSRPIDAWSAVGGLVKNPYSLDRSPCGSSSGTAVAVAASLAAAGVGTETNGSISCPASYNGIVGLKPTVGLLSRTWIVPISPSQDTPGPMGRTVADVATLLTVMAGSDPRDPATRSSDAHKRDYVADLAKSSLSGKRLGVLRYITGFSTAVDSLFEDALKALRQGGAQIIEIRDFSPPDTLWPRETLVLQTEFKASIDRYLLTTPATVAARSLADLIQFNRANPRELVLFGQEGFEQSDATAGLADPAYRSARQTLHRDVAENGIDALLARNKLDALIAPTFGPAYRLDIVTGRHESGDAASLPAIAGYPHLSVPMGLIQGLPVGISFVGKAWSEAQLLGMGAAFEQSTRARQPPTFAPSIEELPATRRAMAPL